MYICMYIYVCIYVHIYIFDDIHEILQCTNICMYIFYYIYTHAYIFDDATNENFLGCAWRLLTSFALSSNTSI